MKRLNIIRTDELAEILSVSPVTIWRMQKRGELPARSQISNRIVGWLESDIEDWLRSRPIVDDNKNDTRPSYLRRKNEVKFEVGGIKK